MRRDYGSTLEAARRHYRGYLQAFVMEDDQPMLDATRANRYAIGDEGFLDQAAKPLEPLRTGRVQDKDLALPVVTVSVDEVSATVAGHYRIKPQDLREHGRLAGASIERLINLPFHVVFSTKYRKPIIISVVCWLWL